MAATLLDRAFAGIDRPSRPVEEIAAESANSPASPPDMQQRICRNRGKAAAQYRAEVEQLMAPLLAAKTPAPAGHLVVTTAENLARPVPIAARIAMVPPAAFDPVPVRIGPPEGYAGLVAEARPPHSPVGTPQPPGTVSAYAPAAPQTEAGDTPLPPDPKALPLRSKAKPVAASPGRHARHGHRLAETQAHGAKPLATRKTAPKAALEKSKAARGKGAGKQPHAAKADLQKHSKAAAKHAPKAHTQAKTGSIHPAKAAGESPEMHAGQ
jgi:D-alanyl-D-alanine carboxypeptidase